MLELLPFFFFSKKRVALFWKGKSTYKRWSVSSFLKSLQLWRADKTKNLAAAAAAKLLQSCPTLCDPIDGSPPGSPVPGILQARTLEWVAISFSNSWKWKVKVKSISRVPFLATPWTGAYQAPPSMGFSRQENWSGVPSPSPACGTRRLLRRSPTWATGSPEKRNWWPERLVGLLMDAHLSLASQSLGF